MKNRERDKRKVTTGHTVHEKKGQIGSLTMTYRYFLLGCSDRDSEERLFPRLRTKIGQGQDI